jgi:hypothetical protein
MNDDFLKPVVDLMQDYSDELWADEEFRNNMMYLLGRYIETGQDLTDEEMIKLEAFIKHKIEKYVKEKGN